MLKISFIEIIIRGVPEAATLMWACYVLSKTKIQLNRYFLSTVIFIFFSYLVRSLPIIMGINTLLLLGVAILTNIKINKISILKSIQVTVIAIILEFICEAINMIIIIYLFKKDLTQVFSNPYSKTLYGIPSLILFVLFISILNALFNKKPVLD